MDKTSFNVKFLIGIICILLHRPKKLTLGEPNNYIVIFSRPRHLTTDDFAEQNINRIYNMLLCGKANKTKHMLWVMPKPSLKIGTANAICWNSLGLFRDYGLNYIFFRNKTIFFKIESFNFQHLFEKEFRETSQNFNSIRQRIEKMKIKIA